MRIKVKVRPNAKSNLVEIIWKADEALESKLRVSGGSLAREQAAAEFLVSTTESAEEDRANRKVQALLADYFNKPKSKIILDYGGKSREKYFEILD